MNPIPLRPCVVRGAGILVYRGEVIFHLALVSDWDAARAAGEYTVSTRGATVAEVGFVHCSTAAQWRGVRERFCWRRTI